MVTGRFVTRRRRCTRQANALHPPQITEQEIKDGLALTMKQPPTQEEVAAVVR
jgi:hypothetical protein